MENNKYSKFGNFLARGGGQPTPTPELLATATPEQLASYDIQRKTARNKGLGEMLLLMGDAFQGRDISGRAAQRRASRQPKERKIVKGADGYNYYETGERVLPGIEKLNNSLGSSKRLSVFDPKNPNQPPKSLLETDYKGIADAEAKGLIVTSLAGFQGAGEDKSTEFERIQKSYNRVVAIPKEDRTEADKLNISIYEQKLFGNPGVIPLFNSDGMVVESITTRDLQLNKNIIKEKQEAGLYTIGEKPEVPVKGKQSTFIKVQDNYLGAKKQLDTINDLANIIEQNKDAFTMAGGLANFVNTAKYQVQSVERLANLTKLKTSSPEKYKKLNNMLDSEYGSILDGISENRAVAKSIFLRLAYGTAKEIDPSGRLSDNDVKIAMDIVGNLGANWKSNLATLENLSKTTSREYMDVYNIRVKDIEDDQERLRADQYGTLPQFLDGMDWRQTGATTSTPASSTAIENLLNKYGG